MAANYSIDTAEGSYRANLVMRLRVSELAMMREVDQAIRSFLDACVEGAFSQSLLDERPPLEVIEFSGRSESSVSYSWQARGLQNSAVRPLIQMVRWIVARRGADMEIEAVELRCWPKIGHAEEAEELAQLNWPRISGPLSFKYQMRSRRGDATDSLVRIELKDAVDQNVLRGIDIILRIWDSMIVRGAFMTEDDSADLCCDPNDLLAGRQTYEASPTIVEHLLYEPVGAGDADSALLNMLARFDRHTLRIAQIVIE